MIEKPYVRILILTVCTFLSFNCRASNSSFKSFTGETLAFRWENLRATETEFITEEDSISIFRNKKHTIYRIPSYHTVTTTNLNKDGDFLSEDVNTTLKFRYFVQKNNEIYGSIYDSINATNYKQRLLVDSFLIKYAFKNSKFDNFENSRKVSTLHEKDFIKETYSPIKGETHPDTIYLYFSQKLQDFEYSFSSRLDSSKNSKLFRIRYVYNAIPPQTDRISIPRQEYLFELKRANIIGQDSIRELIKLNDLLLNSKK
ncbi:hypothetical protein GZH53_01845 [Flavihumibacter sp. R14]|nr:hypothetical protein [Flavihumibacter soli]